MRYRQYGDEQEYTPNGRDWVAPEHGRLTRDLPRKRGAFLMVEDSCMFTQRVARLRLREMLRWKEDIQS